MTGNEPENEAHAALLADLRAELAKPARPQIGEEHSRRIAMGGDARCPLCKQGTMKLLDLPRAALDEKSLRYVYECSNCDAEGFCTLPG
jgi:hypothetical protein